MKFVFVVGEINVDLIFVGCEGVFVFGCEIFVIDFCQGLGSLLMICVMGLVWLGEFVLFVGIVGQDSWGDYCVDVFVLCGIDIVVVCCDVSLCIGVMVVFLVVYDCVLVMFFGVIVVLYVDVIDDVLLV